MPDLILSSGDIVLVSPEDFDWACEQTWRLWRKEPGAAPIVVRDETRNGVSFRIRLMREIAVRARPFLAKCVSRLTVAPANGDYLDARRQNLKVNVRAMGRGRPKTEARPKGYKKTHKGSTDGTSIRPASPLWAGGR